MSYIWLLCRIPKKDGELRTTVISGIILIILGGIATKYLFSDKAELNFLLSDRIPSSFLESNDEETSIQQLELTNSGEIELDRIIIKINSEVLQYDVRKIATSDQIDVVQTKNTLEIIYPRMPIEGRIGVTIKSKGRGISTNNLEITHSKGIAKQVSDSPNLLVYLYLGLILIYLILSANSFRSIYLDSLRHKVYYSAYEDILRKSKPWYVPKNKWEELRKDSIKHCFDRDYSTSIVNSLSYQILNQPIPHEIKPDEWNDLKQKAQESLTKSISDMINRGISWNPEQLLTLVRPTNIDEDCWRKLVELISKAYTVQQILRTSEYSREKDLQERLEQQKPEIIETSDWEDYVDFLERLENLLTLQKRNQAFDTNWNNILFGKEIEALDSLSKEQLEKFESIKQKISDESKKVDEQLIDLSEREKDLIPLENKLEKQLKIIHEVLEDPTTVDRIEDYSNPFNRGNFENLKTIAAVHAKAAKRKK